MELGLRGKLCEYRRQLLWGDDRGVREVFQLLLTSELDISHVPLRRPGGSAYRFDHPQRAVGLSDGGLVGHRDDWKTNVMVFEMRDGGWSWIADDDRRSALSKDGGRG